MPYADPEQRKAFWRKRDAGRREYLSEYRKNHREGLRELKRKYYLDNLDRIRASNREYTRKNKVQIKLRRGRKHNLVCSIGTRLRACLKKHNIPKTHRTLELLGCSIPNFRIYIESKFESGMAWENWGRGNGKWHLDHIMPIAIFDLSKISHQKRCFHFSNYQPLWEVDNFAKGGKPPESHQFRMF